MTTPLLEIKNLHARVDQREILKGLDLVINPGEVHSIMGPNGSGKSTLANVLAGRDVYTITKGEVLFKGKNLLDMKAHERAQAGVFLAFQYPVEIPGVTGMQFLSAAVNSLRKANGDAPVDATGLLKLFRDKAKIVNLNMEMLKRPVNEGFSGGEKKRFEIFQLAVVQPLLAVLDETDSGLDIDALRIVAEGVQSLRTPNRGFLVITHYQRLLTHIVPDFVHVLVEGRIVKSGGKELALELEEKGYTAIDELAGNA